MHANQLVFGRKRVKRASQPADIFVVSLIQPKGSSCTPSGNLGKKKHQWLNPEHVQFREYYKTHLDDMHLIHKMADLNNTPTWVV